jgi:hypothetical protein
MNGRTRHTELLNNKGVVEEVDHSSKEEPRGSVLRIGQKVVTNECMNQSNDRGQQGGRLVEVTPIANGIVQRPHSMHCIGCHYP